MTDPNLTNTSGGAGQDDRHGIRDAARSMGEDLKGRATRTAAAARDEASHRAESAKDSLADEVSDIATALRSASSDLRSNSTSGRTFNWVADSMDEASRALRNKDTGELVNELSRFARRNPAIFLGGAALLGFAASRFAKASARRAHPASDEHPGASTGGSGYAGSSRTTPGSPAAGATAPSGSTGTTASGMGAGASRPVTPSSPTASTTPGGAYNSNPDRR